MKIRARKDWWKPAACGVAVLLGAALPVHAEPMFVAKLDNVVLTLHNEKCALEAVTNLQRRATWVENGITTEGCWGIVQQFGVVLCYFADKTVTGLPAPFFERVSAT